jgi:hypothetical protein
MPSDIEQAEKILTELRGKRETLVAHGVELGEERTRLAFGAHALNDKAARRRLDEINREPALHDAELRSLDCAIAEATTRVNRAQQAEARKADRKRAEEARKLTREFAETFAHIDKCLTGASKGLLAIDAALPELHALGFPSPSHQQLRLAVVTAIATFVQKLPQSWGDEIRGGLRYPAPYERRGLAEYWTKVQLSLDKQIAKRLGDAEQDERAA